MSVPDPEIAAIQQAVNLTYEVSSFEDATTADPEGFRAAFTPTARLAYTSAGRLVERSVDEYVEIRRQIMASGEVQSLNEWEVLGRTEHFGDIAQHFSTYAVRLNGEETLAERGVMSFQLIKVDNRWLVHSLTWQAESDELLLRSSLLPAEPQ